MPHFLLPEGNPMLDNLPGPLKALLEAIFPPDSLGLDPASTMMPLAPLMGAAGKAMGSMGDDLARVARPPGAPAPLTGFAPLAMEAAAKLPPMNMGPKLPMPEGPPAIGHGMPEFVPVGGEQAYNASMTPNLGRAVSNASPMRQTLDAIQGEVGFEGLRDLMKRPIPGRQVQAPPREPKF